MLPDYFVTVVPPQMRVGAGLVPRHRRRGAAEPEPDRRLQPDVVAVFGADHIYRMDVEPDGRVPPGVGRRRHHGRPAGAAGATRRSSACSPSTQPGGWSRFDGEARAARRRMPGDPERALVSMGNYIFSRQPLVDALARRRPAQHRPRLRPLHHSRAGADRARVRLRLPEERGPGREALRGARLLARRRHDRRATGTPTWTSWASRRASTSTTGYWPIRTGQHPGPAARFIGGDVDNAQIGEASLIKRATIRNSILGRSRVGQRGRDDRGLDRHGPHHRRQGRPPAPRHRRSLQHHPGRHRDRRTTPPPTGVATTSTPRASWSFRAAGAASSCAASTSSVKPPRAHRHPRPLLPAAPRESLARGGRGAGLGRARTTTGTSG